MTVNAVEDRKRKKCISPKSFYMQRNRMLSAKYHCHMIYRFV